MGITHHKDKNFEKTFQQNLQNDKLIRGKIFQEVETPQQRLYVWQKLTDIDKFIQKQGLNQKNRYELLQKQPCSCAEAIKIDMVSTFPEQAQVQKIQNIERLQRVLTAFSNRFQQIGYLRGMNFFAQRILSVAGQEKAYYIMSWLFLNDKVIYNVFTSQNSMKNFLQIETQIVQKQVPKLAAVLKHVGIDLQTFATDWIKALFANVCHQKIFYIIFTLALFEGPRVWIFSIVSMIKCLQQKILKSNRTVQKVVQIASGKYFVTSHQMKHKFKQQLQSMLEKYKDLDKQYVDRVGNKIILEEEVEKQSQQLIQ